MSKVYGWRDEFNDERLASREGIINVKTKKCKNNSLMTSYLCSTDRTSVALVEANSQQNNNAFCEKI